VLEVGGVAKRGHQALEAAIKAAGEEEKEKETG
jgi:hypothetical protein